MYVVTPGCPSFRLNDVGTVADRKNLPGRVANNAFVGWGGREVTLITHADSVNLPNGECDSGVLRPQGRACDIGSYER